MEFNFKEIVEALLTQIKPTEEQKALAEARLEVCQECPDRNNRKCGKCGCFLGTKIYTQRENPCPLKKWKDIDRNYYNKQSEKNMKSKNTILV